ncbi:thioesterase family protein [Arthrobacter globiformis]|uniref:Thioesterase n=1 Tax=Arthrobacter globiformis TaxID=1665 RepID=A0A328HF06_ARTGO|nr:thioesterase family protein [Arthrobacter globiformis]RAM36734.1 thioesterase [Arthrobacter globiformis]
MLDNLQIGDTFTLTRTVEEKYCTRRGEYQIFSTPDLVLFIEETAIAALASHLPSHQSSVGTKITVAHVAPTLLGQKVSAVATVREIDRRKVTFEVDVRDDIETIGTSTHERFVVDLDSFGSRLADKKASLAPM